MRKEKSIEKNALFFSEKKIQKFFFWIFFQKKKIL